MVWSHDMELQRKGATCAYWSGAVGAEMSVPPTSSAVPSSRRTNFQQGTRARLSRGVLQSINLDQTSQEIAL